MTNYCKKRDLQSHLKAQCLLWKETIWNMQIGRLSPTVSINSHKNLDLNLNNCYHLLHKVSVCSGRLIWKQRPAATSMSFWSRSDAAGPVQVPSFFCILVEIRNPTNDWAWLYPNFENPFLQNCLAYKRIMTENMALQQGAWSDLQASCNPATKKIVVKDLYILDYDGHWNLDIETWKCHKGNSRHFQWFFGQWKTKVYHQACWGLVPVPSRPGITANICHL